MGKDGRIIASGAAVSVGSGQFHFADMRFSFNAASLTPGRYDLVLVIAPDVGGVGNLSKAMALSNPIRLTIPASTPIATHCIPALLGDTLRLTIDVVSGGQIREREPGEAQAPWIVSWQVINAGTDTLPADYFFANLLHGDFMPLKINDGNTFDFLVIAGTIGTPSVHDTVRIVVTPYGSLGDPGAFPYTWKPGHTINWKDQYDQSAILSWANYWGIPPQILKALIYKENESWDEQSFRYEPWSLDFGRIRGSDTVGITFNTKYPARTALDYIGFARYRMTIPVWLPRGPRSQGCCVSDADIRLREHVYNVTDGDNYLTAFELETNNPGQNWSGTRPQDDFLAQTTVASSYGLTHITFASICWLLEYDPQHDGFPPTQIQDPFYNIYCGAQLLRQYFDGRSGETDWNERWRDALTDYNGGADPNYGPEVYNLLVPVCWPKE